MAGRRASRTDCKASEDDNVLVQGVSGERAGLAIREVRAPASRIVHPILTGWLPAHRYRRSVDRTRLAAIPFFSGVSEEELDAVAQVASELDVAPGQPLTSEGDFGHCLFVIESGSAEVSIDGVPRHEVGPGAIVGEVAVLASGRRTASVVATSPVRVLALFKRDVWALEQQAPEVGRRLREALDEHARASSVE